jgi:hypothetical protein
MAVLRDKNNVKQIDGTKRDWERRVRSLIVYERNAYCTTTVCVMMCDAVDAAAMVTGATYDVTGGDSAHNAA